MKIKKKDKKGKFSQSQNVVINISKRTSKPSNRPTIKDTLSSFGNQFKQMFSQQQQQQQQQKQSYIPNLIGSYAPSNIQSPLLNAEYRNRVVKPENFSSLVNFDSYKPSLSEGVSKQFNPALVSKEKRNTPSFSDDVDQYVSKVNPYAGMEDSMNEFIQNLPNIPTGVLPQTLNLDIRSRNLDRIVHDNEVKYQETPLLEKPQYPLEELQYPLEKPQYPLEEVKEEKEFKEEETPLIQLSRTGSDTEEEKEEIVKARIRPKISKESQDKLREMRENKVLEKALEEEQKQEQKQEQEEKQSADYYNEFNKGQQIQDKIYKGRMNVKDLNAIPITFKNRVGDDPRQITLADVSRFVGLGNVRTYRNDKGKIISRSKPEIIKLISNALNK